MKLEHAMYAQTNVQLFHQLKSEGYVDDDFLCIFRTYEFAVHMFTGRFQPSGNTFLCHVIRVASILASLHLPAEVVAAGLIHSVYRNGDFASGGGLSETKRRQVRAVVGEEVEEYVYKFRRMRWQASITAIRDRLESLCPVDRHLVLMRLANELEHHLDFEILYYSDVPRQLLIQQGHVMTEIAEKLGFPKLAAHLAEVSRRAVSAEIPREIRSAAESKRSFAVVRTRIPQESAVIVPRSWGRSLGVVLRCWFLDLRLTIGLRKKLSAAVRYFSPSY